MAENNTGKLDELTQLLRESIAISREDRILARSNYDSLRSQLDNIISTGAESSEDGRVEQEVNKALKLIFDSSNRLEAVISAITKILMAEMNNASKENIAQSIFGGGSAGFNGRQIITKPVDLKMLMNDEE